MEYEHVIEARVYKYGPGHKLKDHDEAMKFIYMERNRILTKISLAGLYRMVEKLETIEKEDRIILRISMKFPRNVL